ncbi:hypothetical protein ACXYRP_02735 [Mycoplasma sp. 5912]
MELFNFNLVQPHTMEKILLAESSSEVATLESKRIITIICPIFPRW